MEGGRLIRSHAAIKLLDPLRSWKVAERTVSCRKRAQRVARNTHMASARQAQHTAHAMRIRGLGEHGMLCRAVLCCAPPM